MFTTLVESRAPRTRRIGGTVVSALIHGGLIAGAVLLTLPHRGDATPKPPAEPPVVYVPIDHSGEQPTPRREPASTSAPREDWHAPAIDFDPGDIKPIDIVAGPPVPSTEVVIGHAGPVGSNPMGGGLSGGEPGGAFNENQVDRSPALAGRQTVPRYPTQLHAAGIEGRAVLQFVVDTLGRAEMEGVTVVETSHPAFAEAAREVLPRYRFVPGEVAGRKVRTRVQLPFDFTLTR